MSSVMKPTTPLPWRLWPHRERSSPIICTGENPMDLQGIATVSGHPEIADANAAYIVHAANLYPKLIEALEKATRLLDCAVFDAPEDVRDVAAVNEMLKLAKGEQC